MTTSIRFTLKSACVGTGALARPSSAARLFAAAAGEAALPIKSTVARACTANEARGTPAPRGSLTGDGEKPDILIDAYAEA